MVFGKSYSLENSIRESIFREDLFLYNCPLAGLQARRGRHLPTGPEMAAVIEEEEEEIETSGTHHTVNM